MSKQIIWTCEYKLRKNANEEDFLVASEALGDGYISRQKGFVAWKQLKGDGVWVDLMTWETLEDVQNFEKGDSEQNPLALKFYSFINLMSCKTRYYSVEQDH